MKANTRYLFPEFQSPFLLELGKCFDRRRKAICHRGQLEYLTDHHDPYEWVTVKFISKQTPCLILQAVEGNNISVYVRSSARSNRGKLLFRFEDRTVIQNADAIVNVFEQTIDAFTGVNQIDLPHDVLEKMHSDWKSLELRLDI